VLSASELHESGREAVRSGRHAEGARLLARALARASEDPELCARIIGVQAYSASERGTAGDGLALIDAIDASSLLTRTQGILANQRALLLMRAGDRDGALAAFDRALRLLGDDPGERARALLNRGNVHLQHRDLDRARADFAESSAVGAQVGEALTAAQAAHNLGYAELLSGRLPEALRAMDAARPDAVGQGSSVDRAVADSDRAQVLIAAGLTREADATLARVAGVFGRLRLRQSQAEAELTRAELLFLTGRAGSAVRLAGRAAARFRRRGAVAWSLRAEALALGARVESGRVPRDAVAAGSALEAALVAVGLRNEARTVRLRTLRAALALGDTATVDRVLRTVRVPRSAPVTTRLLAQIVRADVARTRGRPAIARRHLRSGLNELFAWQSSFGSLDLQTGVAGHGRALASRGLRLAVEDARPSVVFEWSERARAFASRLPAVRPPADPAGAAALARLRQVRAEAGLAPDHEMRRQLIALEREVRDRALYPPGPVIVNEPLDLDDLRSQLATDDGTLVSHLAVDGRLHALVATNRDVSVHALGELAPLACLTARVSSDLDAAAGRLPTPIRTAVGASLRGGCAQLAATLLDPLPLSSGPVLLVPSAALAAVPWTMLAPLSGRPVAMARTATAWALTRRPDETVRRVGLVAGPDVDRAEEEVRRAAIAWASHDAVCGADATADAVTTLACRVDLLHIAAHGTHSADNPLFSGLELVDGPWFGHDIAAVDPVPAHVVLSSCELGRATVRSGEETLGMTAAWQHAGARTVVASPVRVNDDAACEVLAAHHARLAAGDRPAVALAAASAALPRDAAPAPLLCFGAGW